MVVVSIILSVLCVCMSTSFCISVDVSVHVCECVWVSVSVYAHSVNWNGRYWREYNRGPTEVASRHSSVTH